MSFAARWPVFTRGVAVLMLGFGGACATTTPDSTLRSRFGRVQVVTTAPESRFVVQLPKTKSGYGLASVEMPKGEPVVDAISIALTPVVAVVGGVAGLVGENQQVATANIKVLGETFRRLQFDALLRAQVAAMLPAAHRVDPLDPRKAEASELRLTVYEPGLKADGLGLRLMLQVGVQIIARTGGELYHDYLDYRGPRRTSSESASDGGRLLRDEIEASVRSLAREIVDQAFVRTSAAPRPLADGITRERR